VLAQIQKITTVSARPSSRTPRPNVRLRKIESDQRRTPAVKVTRANLKIAQDSLAADFVIAYTSTQDNSTLSGSGARRASTIF